MFTISPITQAMDEAEAAIIRAEAYRDTETDHNEFIQYMLNEDARRKHFRLVTLASGLRNAQFN